MKNSLDDGSIISNYVQLPPIELINEWLINGVPGYPYQGIEIMYLDRGGKYLGIEVFSQVPSSVIPGMYTQIDAEGVNEGIQGTLSSFGKKGVVPGSIHVSNGFKEKSEYFSDELYLYHYKYENEPGRSKEIIIEELISLIIKERLIFSSYNEKYRPRTDLEKKEMDKKIAVAILKKSGIHYTILNGYEPKKLTDNSTSTSKQNQSSDMYDDYSDVYEYIINHD